QQLKSPGLGRSFFVCGRLIRKCHAPTLQPITENPPSTGIAVPVTKSDALDARKTAMPAKSAIAPHRAAGVRAKTLSCRPSICSRARLVRSVSIQPGSTALAWMLSAAQAHAQERVNCTMPPLLAAYAGAKLAPKIDIIEPILMILPPPAFFIAGWTACEHKKALGRLVLMMLSHSSSE